MSYTIEMSDGTLVQDVIGFLLVLQGEFPCAKGGTVCVSKVRTFDDPESALAAVVRWQKQLVDAGAMIPDDYRFQMEAIRSEKHAGEPKPMPARMNRVWKSRGGA